MVQRMFDTTGMERIGGGKTKDILYDRRRDPDLVFIRSRDDISAGDGARRDIMTGKAELSTTTTVNNFRLLDHAGIWNHYVKRLDRVTFEATKCVPIPIECVARRYAAGGSFPKRMPDVTLHHRFRTPLIEFFWKQDVGEYTDPYMVYDVEDALFELHPAKEPTTADNVLETILLNDIPGFDKYAGDPVKLVLEMESVTLRTFLLLETTYDAVGLTVVDFKIEFGIDPQGDLTIIDVIDADSWRAWVDGDPDKAVDKEYFRQHPGEPADTSLPAFRLVAEKSAEIARHVI